VHGGRDWMSLLGSLPDALAACPDESRVFPTVAWCVVPNVADGLVVDRLEGSSVRQEHAHHVSRGIANALHAARAPRPLQGDSAVARVLRGEEASMIAEDGHSMIVGLPRTSRALTFLGEEKFTDYDLTRAEVLAQWVAFALNVRTTDPAAINTSLAAAVHDLVNPLTVITANARGLRRGEDAEVRISMIERAAERMHRIATDALDQIRGATDRVSIELCWTYTEDLFEEAASAIRDAAEARRITVEVQDADGLVVCDRSRILQVLVNLLENAVKFTPAGGIITMSAARVDDRVRIRVTDSGRGIPAAELPRLFERYWRNSGGTGIGLATARALVAAHDSELAVASTVGAGSTFWFDLHCAG